MATIGRAYAFLARLRADTRGAGRLPPVSVVHRAVVHAPVRSDILKDQGVTTQQT